MQREFHGKARGVGLEQLGASPIGKEQRAFLVVRHPHVLALLPVVPHQLDQAAIFRGEWKLREDHPGIIDSPGDDGVRVGRERFDEGWDPAG